MKTLLLSFLFSVSVFAYEFGSNLDGAMLKTLQINDSKTYIISFFASWCHSCEKELPDLDELHQGLDKTRYEIIGVDIDKDIENAKVFQKSLDLSFRVINDNKQNIVSVFKPIGMPSLYIIKDKKVLHVMTGARDDIDEVISNYLGIQDD